MRTMRAMRAKLRACKTERVCTKGREKQRRERVPCMPFSRNWTHTCQRTLKQSITNPSLSGSLRRECNPLGVQFGLYSHPMKCKAKTGSCICPVGSVICPSRIKYDKPTDIGFRVRQYFSKKGCSCARAATTSGCWLTASLTVFSPEREKKKR